MKNSNIYKNPQDRAILDFTTIGIKLYENKIMDIHQENHYFDVGDALFYNIETHKFEKALAENSMFSEVCGVVSEIKSLNDFIIISFGEIKTNRYPFELNTPLYLSDIQPGKLISLYPAEIVKEIATRTQDGIMVNIKRALKTTATPETNTLEAYTQEELDEIILNIW